MKEGNARFQANLKANRNLLEQVNITADRQYPFAVILSCIDSRTSAELIFDQEENVEHVVHEILEESQVLNALVAEGQVGIVGAMYSVRSGTVQFQDMFCGNAGWSSKKPIYRKGICD